MIHDMLIGGGWVLAIRYYGRYMQVVNQKLLHARACQDLLFWGSLTSDIELAMYSDFNFVLFLSCFFWLAFRVTP